MEHSERILFVDDDAPVRTAFVRSLRSAGLSIDVADGGEAALALAAKERYAVIATDYRMPDIDGLDLIEQLRQVQPDASYMLVSGECDLNLALEAVNDHNVASVLCKPWNNQQLSELLRQAIDAHWERSSSHAVQRSMVQASKEISEQRRRLEEANHDSNVQVADTLISALDMRGHETASHCRRVAGYALILAEELGLRGKILTIIEQGALLHDIGKIGIPDAIIFKTGKLSEQEWELTRGHSEIGARLLSGFANFNGAREIVRQHHERWDGTGYPRGLRETEIVIGARIFAVADAIEAITSDRLYRKGASIEEAAAEIARCSGSHFDPEVVAAFSRVPVQRWAQVRAQYPEAGSSVAA